MNELKAIIVEDEVGAANNLRLVLNDINPKIEVLACLASIEETVAWLTSNRQPGLGFFDIQLEDGLSFEIFKKCNIDFPVIFTTAFDEYAIDAFKVNSIDYLLKPIKEADLRFSLAKYSGLKKWEVSHTLIQRVTDTIEARQKTCTFLIHSKDRLIPIPDKDFAYFYIENGLLHGCTRTNQLYPIDQTIEELVEQLNTRQFFRANRQVIVNRLAIVEVEFYFNGRLSLALLPAAKNSVLISKSRVPVFKEWLKGQ